MSSDTLDVVTLIRADHEKVALLLDTWASGDADRADVLRQIIKNLAQHTAAEESEVYPRLDGIDDATVRHARDEHAEMTEMLITLEDADPESDETGARVARLAGAVQAHVAEEERVLLPRLTAALGPDVLQHVASRYITAKETGPTRPHRHAPRNEVTGVIAGVVDRARDALHRD
jgi:acetyl esterase